MVKKKADPLQHINSYNNNIAQMNEAFQKATEPMKNIQCNMLSSALREQIHFQYSAAEQLKGLNAFDQFQSAAVTAAQSYTQSIAPFSVQMSDLIKQMKVPTSTGLEQLAESLQRFNNINTRHLTTALVQIKQNWNQSWFDSWNQNFGALSSAALNNYINDYENYRADYDDEVAIKPEEIEAFKSDLVSLDQTVECEREQKFAEFWSKWTTKHKVLAFFLIYVLLPICLSLGANYIQFGITKTMATIRSQPSTQSETVAVFDLNQKMTVIDDQTPYYYQIEYCDPTTGAVKTGWVSKKSVMIIKEEIIEETVAEE